MEDFDIIKGQLIAGLTVEETQDSNIIQFKQTVSD